MSMLSLSALFWGVDLCRDLPRELTHGTWVVKGELERARAFIAREFVSLTEEHLGASPTAQMVVAKNRYLGSVSDMLELRHRDETVGVLIGAPEDWSTYYLRVLAVAPRFQRPGVVRRLLNECLCEPLRVHGVERIVAETSPANRGMPRIFDRYGFYASGQQLTDRWGPLVRFVKFLDPACEAAFLRRSGAPRSFDSTPKKEGGQS